MVARPPEGERRPLDADDVAGLERMGEFRRTGAGYQEIQGTKPQTLGYGLDDSPAGLAAWIVEKFRAWTDCDGDVERSFTKDQLLTNITAYWVTATATSSTRLYYETRQSGAQRAAGPQGRRPHRRRQLRRRDHPHAPAVGRGVVRPGALDRHPRGGHFAAMEVPDLFVAEVRTFADRFRPA